ncbi:MAG: ATPase domain-containing protein [Candidatus Thermoplasmatota archaeon]
MSSFDIIIDILKKEPIKRVKTGLDKLDILLGGGFPENSIILVSGTPGSGKTIFCYHFINAGLKNNERCLFLTSDERIEKIICQARTFGFDFETPMRSGLLKFMYIDLDRSTVYKEMEENIKGGSYSRIVLDSLTPIVETPIWLKGGGYGIIPSFNDTTPPPSVHHENPVSITRTYIRRLLSLLYTGKSTAVVTSEIPEGSRSLSRDSISEFLVDGILIFDLDTTMDRRKLTIRKMRGTRHSLKQHNMEINENGIVIQ